VILPQFGPYRHHRILFIDTGKTDFGDNVLKFLPQLNLRPDIVRLSSALELEDLPNAAEPTYGCVIVDSNQTARRLRDVERFKYIPLVMLTPSIEVSFRSALEDGISSYMTTPCHCIDLGNALLPALEGRATTSMANHSKSFNILLAEDNAVNQRLAVRILEKYHHTVTVANNGLEALEAIKKKRYDVVLMDVQMPVMGGFEATGKIREWERENGTSRTPVIALTAHAMVGDREKCIQAQMDVSVAYSK